MMKPRKALGGFIGSLLMVGAPYTFADINQKYDRAYTVFVSSGNVKEAFEIAEKSLKLHPDDPVWQQRYIQSAQWSGQPYYAFKELSALALQKKGDRQKALKLGAEIGAYHDLIPLLLDELKQKPHDEATIMALAEAYDNDGQTNKAVNLLTLEIKQKNNVHYWQQLTHLYKLQGDTDKELQLLYTRMQREGRTVDINLRRAEIYASLGKLSTAKTILKIMPIDKALRNTHYWKKLGDLGWATADDQTAIDAYSQLVKQRDYSPENLRRLILLIQDREPKRALRLSMQGWHKYHDLNFYLLALSPALQLKDWSALNTLYRELTASQKISLQAQLSYWQGRARLVQNQQGSSKARHVLTTALVQHPQLDILKPAYIGLLVEQLSRYNSDQDFPGLTKALRIWAHLLPTHPELWGVYTEAYLLLDKPRIAALINQPLVGRMQHHPLWLIQYAGMLEKLNYVKEAYNLRAEIWQKLWVQFQNTDNKPTQSLQRGINALSPYFTGSNLSYSLLAAATVAQTTSPDNLLSFALENNQDDLARYLIAYYYPEGAPIWAVVKIALLDHQQKILQTALSTQEKVIPATDRVAAAKVINDLPLSQRLAFEGAEAKPDDNARHTQLTDVLLQNANIIDYVVEYFKFGSLLGPKSDLKAKLFLNAAMSITPYATAWFSSTNDSTQVVSPASLDQTAGILVDYRTDKNYFTVNLGERLNLYTFATVFLSDSYQFNSRTIATLNAGFNQRSAINDLMLAGGIQDELSASLSYSVTAKDRILTGFKAQLYSTQDRVTLGNGYILWADYSRKLWQDYPDFTAHIFGNIDRLTARNTTLTGKVANLIPVGMPTTARTFIPPSFAQIGAGAGFGEKYKTEYTKAWRLYVTVNALYDTFASAGYLADAGLAGSVFGRDKLLVYASSAATLNGEFKNNTQLGMQYKVYF